MRHAAAAATCAGLAVIWTFPLATHLSTHIPGGPGDNMAFLWNFWWMRTALAAGHDVFSTPYLFAPHGIALTLNTHTVLPAFAGATVLGGLPLVAAHNLALIASLALNAFCTYVLAWRITRDAAAAMVAGIAFGSSSFIAAHLTGHVNLTTAWVLPLFALAAAPAAARASIRGAAAAGAILGLTAYVDYYYVVFELALLVCLLLFNARRWSFSRSQPGRSGVRAARIIAALIAIVLALLLALALTGGFRLQAGPVRLSLHSAFNPLQILWVLAAAWLFVRHRPRLHSQPPESFDLPRTARALGTLVVVFSVVAAPIIWNAIDLVRSGGYVSQAYHWRSAPKGIDIGTLVLGHPWHGLWGERVRSIYASMQIDHIESTAWLGVTAPLLAALALRRRWTDRSVRLWALIGGVFAIWALGPHLMAFGTNTAMILPQTALRILPIVSNARIPGRAMIVVHLALAVLAAVGLAEWRRRSSRPTAIGAIVALVLLFELLPAPIPMSALDRPAVYAVLRDRPEQGALLELPFGIRDGFGHRGQLDDRVLYYQSIHGRPMVGGFAARIPPPLLARIESDPLLSALLDLSAGELPAAPLPDREVTFERLHANGITFVVVNRAAAPPMLLDYVERILPLELVMHDGNRSLYLVRQPPSAGSIGRRRN